MSSSIGNLHGGIRRVMIFVALLLAVSAVPVLAEEPEEPQGAEPPALEPLDPSMLPAADDVTKAIEQAEDEEAAQEEWLSSPAASQERDQSRLRHAGVSSTEAEALFRTAFAEQIAVLNADPARFLSDAQLIATSEEPTDATVKADGDAMLLDAGIPVRTESEDGELEKVDLSLEPTADGFETTNAIVDVTIPDIASGETAVGDDGLAIAQQDLLSDSEARSFGEADVFYPEVLTDTDLIISPIAGGVEVFNQLRSENSPETFSFEVDLPAGSELRQSAWGDVEVAAGEEVLAFMPAPVAVDAQGTNVPVDLALEGNSITLEVAHRSGDYAMPILLDPILENNENWIYGQNHNALDMGVWQLQKNVAGMYGSTYCIYHCFGQPSNVRGLFVSGQSGTYWPNQFAHWVYSAPNTNTFITSTTLSPYVRYDHGCNAATTSHKQPHDYFGIWGASNAWNYVSVNSANQPGNQYTLSQDGQAAIFGLGTGGGPAFSIPCWRDLYAGGAHVWLDDWSQPKLDTTSTAQWMDTTPIRLNVSASDVGLGIGWFTATAANSSGAAQTWKTSHGCTGTRRSPCPGVWNLAQAGQPILSYAPAAIPTGIRDLSVTAYDPANHQSTETRIMTVRVDHAKPTIALTGTITEQAKLGTERAVYTLKAVAKDGNKSGTNAEQQSGVKQLILKMDGKVFDTEPAVAGCPTQSCSVTLEESLATKDLLVGNHTIQAIAEDALGHKAEATQAFSVARDTVPPVTTLGGQLGTGTSPVGKQGSFTFSTSDAISGVVSAKILIDNSMQAEYSQSCPNEGCSLSKSITQALDGMPSGAHSIRVLATDAAGNTSEAKNTFYVDLKPPQVTLAGTLKDQEGMELTKAVYALGFTAVEQEIESGRQGSGLVAITMEVDDTVAKQWTPAHCATSPCPTVMGEYAYEKAAWPGPHVVYVTATDKAGNSSMKAVPVGYPTELSMSQDCGTGDVEGEIDSPLGAQEAAAIAQEEAGGLLDPSQTVTAAELQLSPSLAPTTPAMTVTGTIPGGAVSGSPEEGAMVGGSHCVVPVAVSEDATSAIVVGGDAAIYANTAEDTDTIVRPTALGVTVAQQIRSSDAPDTYEWDLELPTNQDLVKLPSGAVAVVQPESSQIGSAQGDEKVEASADAEGYGETKPVQPDPVEDAADTGKNLAYEEWQLASAQEEVASGMEVVAVIPSPWVRTAGGIDVPAFLTVAEDRVILHIEDLPGPEEPEGEEGPVVKGSFPAYTGFQLLGALSNQGCAAQASKPYVRKAETYYNYKYKGLFWGASMRCEKVQWMKVTVSGQQEKSIAVFRFWDTFVGNTRELEGDGPIGILDGGECKSSGGAYNNFRSIIHGNAIATIGPACANSNSGNCQLGVSDSSAVARYRCVGGGF